MTRRALSPLLLSLPLFVLAPAGASAQSAGAEPVAEPSLDGEPASVQDDGLPWPGFDRVRIALLAGLIQPIALEGGNVEVDLYYGRLVIGYSHGFLLNIRGGAVVGNAAAQGVEYFLPYSTGLSVGYRFLDWLDVRLEAKLHQFDVRDAASGQDLFSYTTFTLGIGAYAQYRPFYDFGIGAETDEWLHGFMLVASVRFWPNVWTSLDDDRVIYSSEAAGVDAIHDAANIGIADSPFIANIAVGYSVTF